jgi:large subunit ribosomal protein L15
VLVQVMALIRAGGAKGQKARAGSSIPVGFEGGRMPLHRQLPKRRGFKSLTPKAVSINLDDLEKKFNAGQTVNPKELFNKGLVKDSNTTVKILSKGEIKKALTFEKVSVSGKALEKIAKAGGKVVSSEEKKA